VAEGEPEDDGVVGVELEELPPPHEEMAVPATTRVRMAREPRIDPKKTSSALAGIASRPPLREPDQQNTTTLHAPKRAWQPPSA
jgi:hypothetical protein